MKKPIYNTLLTMLIAAPFVALGSFVNTVTPVASPTHTASAQPVLHGLQAVNAAGQAVGQVEQAQWLKLTPASPEGKPVGEVVSVVQIWSV
ncbi:MAG: hypothetical protein M1346_02275 [Gammaproteobacteria bacterium]|jgi:5-hydroxyisourate hydrolase|uniref:hypothetical protein n=1 Tax=Acidithiobacillus sp. TaxID=1872118 RepID=UPI00260AEE6C|nr:hypothetical protein [Acidithiobacillus sp.]MCL5052051.1 hypothetical protein [Gammaproteobacteria bacterium]